MNNIAEQIRLWI